MKSGRRPLVVGVAELLRRPGARREIEVTAELADLAVSSARVPDGEPVEVSLVLESLPEGITATGHLRSRWVGECRRCLREIGGPLDTSVREVFEPHPVEGETYELAGDQLDLEPMVRDAVLLALPLAPLCAEDCAGPAPELFPARRVDTEAGDDAPAGEGPGDPRWAALDALRFDAETDDG